MQGCLSVYEADGEVYSVHLPIKARRMWPLLEGLIVERLTVEDELYPDPEVPTMFSLLHPLEELKPVAMSHSRHATSAAGNSDGQAVGGNSASAAPVQPDEFMADPMERIVFACTHEAFCVSYNERERLHSIWVVRQSRADALRRSLSTSRDHGILRTPVVKETFGPTEDNSPLKRQQKLQRRAVEQHSAEKVKGNSAGRPIRRSRRKSNKSGPGSATRGAIGRSSSSMEIEEDDYSFIESKRGGGTEPSPSPAFRTPRPGVVPVMVEEEADIRSELLFERVWKQEEVSPICSSIFLASDAINQPLLCLFSTTSKTLTALQLSVFVHRRAYIRARPVFTLQAVAAVPVRSGRYSTLENHASAPFNYDILILTEAGHLCLYTGDDCVCYVQVHMPPSVRQRKDAALAGGDGWFSPSGDTLQLLSPVSLRSKEFQYPIETVSASGKGGKKKTLRTPRAKTRGKTPVRSSGRRRSGGNTFKSTPTASSKGSTSRGNNAHEPTGVVDILDPVENRVTLVMADGEMYRASLPTLAESPLVRACLASFACSLSPRLMQSLRHDHIEWDRAMLAQVSHGNASRWKDSEMEWKQFALFLETMIEACWRGEYPDFKSSSSGSSDVDSNLITPVKKPSDRSFAFERSGDEAWQALLSSEYHNNRMNKHTLMHLGSSMHTGEHEEKSDATGRSSSSLAAFASLQSSSLSSDLPGPSFATDLDLLRKEFPRLVRGLHLVYEDMKLNVLNHCHLRSLAVLLFRVAVTIGRPDYMDHYARDFGDLYGSVSEEELKQTSASLADVMQELPSPPNIFKWVMDTIQGHTSKYDLFPPGSDSPCELTRKVCHFFDVLTRQNSAVSRSGSGRFGSSSGMRGGATPKRASEYSPSASQMDTSFPSPLSTPETRRAEADTDYPLFAPAGSPQTPPQYRASSSAESVILAMVEERFSLTAIDCLPFGISLPLREAMRSCRHSPPGHWPAEAYALIGRKDLAKNFFNANSSEGASGETTHNKLFGPSSTGGVGGPESKMRDDLGGFNAFRSSHETENERLENAVATRQGTDATKDPDGTGLVVELSKMRFGRDCRLEEVRRLLQVNRPQCLVMPVEGTVPEEEKPSVQQSRLRSLSSRKTALCIGRGMFTLATIKPVLTDVMPIPHIELSGRVPPQNTVVELDVSVIAERFLDWPSFHNGVAAGLRVSPIQTKITRTWIVYNRPEGQNHTHAGFLMALGLQGHLTALAPADFYAYLTQNHHATAVGILIGMAAAKRGTSDTTVSKMLCLHIPALVPQDFMSMQLSSTVQTAALMGLGLLYQGTANRLMTEVLINEIGRRPISDRFQDREAYSLSAGLALGFITLGKGAHPHELAGLSDLNIADRLSRYMNGGKEESLGNVTFGLNHSGGDSDAKCSTIKEGESVNVNVTAPGAILALALMFLKSNDRGVAERLAIPDSLFKLEYVRPDFILLKVLARSLVMWDYTEASMEWIESQIPEFIMKHINAFESSFGASASSDIDMVAVWQAYCNILAGCCLAIGIRFAGSHYPAAQQVLFKLLDRFKGFRKNRDSFKPESKVDRQTLEVCICSAAVSLGMVMAGTGHLESLRLIRSLRTSFDEEIQHGHHMAIHMAIGFLFLGGGRCTLSTSSPAVAALLCAVFPRWPAHTGDNRYHMQALRHLYVLAWEPRFIETRDVDTGESCYVPLEITVREGRWYERSSVDILAPCLLPEFDTLASIRIKSPRYWPMTLDLENNKRHLETLRQQRVIYVKRKTGHLLYSQDEKGLKGILSRSFPKDGSDAMLFPRSQKNREEFVRSFSADPSIVAFAKHFCSDDSERARFCTNVLYSCLTHEKPEMLPTYLSIYQAMEQLRHQENSLSLWNLLLALSYYHTSLDNKLRASWTSEPLLQSEFMASLELKLHSFFGSLPFEKQLSAYLSNGSHPVFTDSQVTGSPKAQRVLFALMLTYLRMPSLRDIDNGRALMRARGVASPSLPILALLYPGVPVSSLQVMSSFMN